MENLAFGLQLSEFHTGYRAFRRGVLELVNYSMNSDGFIFDQEIIAQVVAADFRIAEIPVPTRYFKEASSASFGQSVAYGLKILWLVVKYRLFRWRCIPGRQFVSLRARYTKAEAKLS